LPVKLEIGAVLAERYRIEAVLGSGAMGTVYRARHLKVGRAFAIKVLHHQLLRDPKILRRFDREAEIAGTLDHPNVVSVVDAGETTRGERYLAMELADGEALASLIAATGPLPGPRVLRIAQQLCDGLAHAHELGLVHRDFKPDNVIVQRDATGREVPRIVDFGIATLGERSESEADRLTTAGVVLGTPHYMAPEHARGVAIDHRADLFALGIICFEMLTGCMPFDGDGPEVARANLAIETPRMGTRVPDLEVDPLLEAFTRKLMMKSPNRRPQTAREARRLLDLIATDRLAAAKELGVDAELEAVVARATQPMVPEIPPEVPIPVQAEGSHQILSVVYVPMQPEQVVTTEKQVVRPRARWPFALVALALLSTAALTCVLVRSDVEPAKPPVVTLAASEEPIAIEVVTPAREEVPTQAITTQLPVRPVAPQTIPPTTNVVPADDPSAQEIAALYTVVGRALRKLENGDPVVQDLWIRYRRIRLNEVIATPEGRRATKATLDELHAKLDSM
jgi:tRNA A-37 threonylcarbamoyl transferase component Bud32